MCRSGLLLSPSFKPSHTFCSRGKFRSRELACPTDSPLGHKGPRPALVPRTQELPHFKVQSAFGDRDWRTPGPPGGLQGAQSHPPTHTRVPSPRNAEDLCATWGFYPGARIPPAQTPACGLGVMSYDRKHPHDISGTEFKSSFF